MFVNLLRKRIISYHLSEVSLTDWEIFLFTFYAIFMYEESLLLLIKFCPTFTSQKVCKLVIYIMLLEFSSVGFYMFYLERIEVLYLLLYLISPVAASGSILSLLWRKWFVFRVRILYEVDSRKTIGVKGNFFIWTKIKGEPYCK